MAEQRVRGVNLYYEDHGEGSPIVLIHGCGGSALAFADAVTELAKLGRVIVYDRRGCARSERPEPYGETSVAEHADDAAALLEALDAAPAIVIGRSYGGTIAADLALRYPDQVRASVMLEPDAPPALAPKAAKWIDALAERLREVAARHGTDAVGQALITAVAGDDAWRSFPDQWHQVLTQNGPAILAELRGEWWLEAEAEALATITQPALLVAAAESPPEFHEPINVYADALPNARTALVGGDHIIDPAAAEVIAFIEEVLKHSAAGLDTASISSLGLSGREPVDGGACTSRDERASPRACLTRRPGRARGERAVRCYTPAHASDRSSQCRLGRRSRGSNDESISLLTAEALAFVRDGAFTR